MILDGYQTDAYLRKLTQTSESKSETINGPKMTGWICPVCGRGVSPYTSACPCNGWGWGVTNCEGWEVHTERGEQNDNQ